ncbi:MAG: hypothetical protein K9N46_00990 [Candidatus Marinimicrobia bacterium]|nr:hypothetical protein [Candidatus Neomarinimicrobiota bacterium]MCF7827947.1 hypothetical protein [Candidatus Neomarinimicrobiota bacterium]MCF7879298.1 hypothetical protein [Candidatus Neomarinimicrobiota bacterium]
MNNAMFQEVINQNLAEKFWNELNNESEIPVEFADAALCFTTLRQLTHGDNTVDMPQA